MHDPPCWSLPTEHRPVCLLINPSVIWRNRITWVWLTARSKCHSDMSAGEMFVSSGSILTKPANCDNALCQQRERLQEDSAKVQICKLQIHTRQCTLGSSCDTPGTQLGQPVFLALVHPGMTQLCEGPRQGCGNCGNDTAQESAFVLDAVIMSLKKVPLYSVCNLIWRERGRPHTTQAGTN